MAIPLDAEIEPLRCIINRCFTDADPLSLWQHDNHIIPVWGIPGNEWRINDWGAVPLLIIGELINTSRATSQGKPVERAVLERDSRYIADLARRQIEAGADYLDINAGTLGSGEPEAMEWITRVVNEAVDAPICFDSPNPEAIRRGLDAYDKSKGQPIVNSISAERRRLEGTLPLVLEHNARVVALAMNYTGIGREPAQRMDVAARLVLDLTGAGVPLSSIYVDPLILPIATGDDAAQTALDTIHAVMSHFPGIHTVAGISNVSHGMPQRRYLNRAMAVLAMGMGLDAAILDPTDGELMALIGATRALTGKDPDSKAYVRRMTEKGL